MKNIDLFDLTLKIHRLEENKIQFLANSLKIKLEENKNKLIINIVNKIDELDEEERKEIIKIVNEEILTEESKLNNPDLKKKPQKKEKEHIMK